jgi:hypothetical protein
MGLSGSRFSNSLYATLMGMGFVGSRLHEFTDAVGIGSDNHVSGKAFETNDNGEVSGSGMGMGTGLTGIVSTTVGTAIFALATGSGFVGAKLFDTCEAIGTDLVIEMGFASLASTDSPVYEGTGLIIPGSIAVTESGWNSEIYSQGTSEGFMGSRWSDYSNAIAGGCVTGFLTATGMLTITGSGSGSGTGTGTGMGHIS